MTQHWVFYKCKVCFIKLFLYYAGKCVYVDHPRRQKVLYWRYCGTHLISLIQHTKTQCKSSIHNTWQDRLRKQLQRQWKSAVVCQQPWCIAEGASHISTSRIRINSYLIKKEDQILQPLRIRVISLPLLPGLRWHNNFAFMIDLYTHLFRKMITS